MDKYDELKQKIESYQNLPDVEISQEKISVYDLHLLIENRLEEIRDLRNYKKDNVEEINKGNFFRRATKFLKKNPSYSDYFCTALIPQCFGNYSNISFYFKDKKGYRNFSILDVCKEMGSNQIYFGRSSIKDPEFVAQNIDYINHIFDALESAYVLFNGQNEKKELLTDDFFKVDLKYERSFGRVEMSISLNKECDKEDIFNRNWATRQTLSELVNENCEMILKKISVNINELDPTTQTIVKESLSKINAPQLIKKK